MFVRGQSVYGGECGCLLSARGCNRDKRPGRKFVSRIPLFGKSITLPPALMKWKKFLFAISRWAKAIPLGAQCSYVKETTKGGGGGDGGADVDMNEEQVGYACVRRRVGTSVWLAPVRLALVRLAPNSGRLYNHFGLTFWLRNYFFNFSTPCI